LELFSEELPIPNIAGGLIDGVDGAPAPALSETEGADIPLPESPLSGLNFFESMRNIYCC